MNRAVGRLLRGATRPIRFCACALCAGYLLLAAANGPAGERKHLSDSAESGVSPAAPQDAPTDAAPRTSAKARLGGVPWRFTDSALDARVVSNPESPPMFYGDFVGDKRVESRIVRLDQGGSKTKASRPIGALLRYTQPPVFAPDQPPPAPADSPAVTALDASATPVAGASVPSVSDHRLKGAGDLRDANAKLPVQETATVLGQDPPSAASSQAPELVTRDRSWPAKVVEPPALMTPTVIGAAPLTLSWLPAPRGFSPMVINQAPAVAGPAPAVNAAEQTERDLAPAAISVAPLAVSWPSATPMSAPAKINSVPAMESSAPLANAASPAVQTTRETVPTVVGAAPLAVSWPPAAPVAAPVLISAVPAVKSSAPFTMAADTAGQTAINAIPTVVGAAPLAVEAAGIASPVDEGMEMALRLRRQGVDSPGGEGLLARLAEPVAEQTETANSAEIQSQLLPAPRRPGDQAEKPGSSPSKEPSQVADGHEEVEADEVDPGFLRMDQLTMRVDVPVEKDDRGDPLPLPEDHAKAYFAKKGATPAEWLPYSYWMEEIGYGPALNFCYGPLYFEEVNLERYGTALPAVQPAVSAARFFGTMAILPYRLATYRPNRCFYQDHHFRPGTPAPCEHAIPWLRPAGVVTEAGAIVGLILLIP